MVPIFYDLDYENMFLNVLKGGSGIVSHYAIFKQKSIGLGIFIQICSIF
jgi:hypothetical protein